MKASCAYVTHSVRLSTALLSVRSWIRMSAHQPTDTSGLPSDVTKEFVIGSVKVGPNGARVLAIVKVTARVTHLRNVKPHVRHYKHVTYCNVSFTLAHTYVMLQQHCNLLKFGSKNC